jgi:hypothetical protein
MAIAMLAVVRAHALEPVFGGLDRAVRFHRILGPSAILLLIAHVIFLALGQLESGDSIGDVFVPFWSPSARSIDILVFYLLLLLGGLAYDRRMSLHLLVGVGDLELGTWIINNPLSVAKTVQLHFRCVLLIDRK